VKLIVLFLKDYDHYKDSVEVCEELFSGNGKIAKMPCADMPGPICYQLVPGRKQ